MTVKKHKVTGTFEGTAVQKGKTTYYVDEVGQCVGQIGFTENAKECRWSLTIGGQAVSISDEEFELLHVMLHAANGGQPEVTYEPYPDNDAERDRAGTVEHGEQHQEGPSGP